jgi:hypothetical protein
VRSFVGYNRISSLPAGCALPNLAALFAQGNVLDALPEWVRGRTAADLLAGRP